MLSRNSIQAKEALELRTEELAHSLVYDARDLGIHDRRDSGDGRQRQRDQLQRKVRRDVADTPRDHGLEGTPSGYWKFASQQFKDSEQFRARVEDIYASSPPESYDLLELLDGRVIERFSRIQRIDERNVGRVWSFRDITERRRAEQALQKKSEWLRITLASIGDAVITTDAEGHVASLNPVAESLTGLDRPGSPGKAP